MFRIDNKIFNLYSLFSVSCFFTFLISGLTSLLLEILKLSVLISVFSSTGFTDFLIAVIFGLTIFVIVCFFVATFFTLAGFLATFFLTFLGDLV